MKKTKKALKQIVKDIGMFSTGSLVLGAGAKAVAPYGTPYGSGLSTVGRMMPSVGSLVMMKSHMRLLGSAMDVLPKIKRRKRK